LTIDDTFCLVDYGLLEGRDIFFLIVFIMFSFWLMVG